MSDTSFDGSLLQRRLQAASGRLLWLGVAMVVLGCAAIVFPAVSTLLAALLVGWVLLIAGVLMLAGAFHIHGTGPFFGALLLGLLLVAAGVFLLFNPLAGAVALTLVLGILFMFQGALEIFFAVEMRPYAGWTGMLLSGIASIAMALLIAGGWPGISAIVLGILLGVNFVSTGLGYIFVSRALRPPV
jgi:uncharacterized membrane protein HdeD (DUF308 family)